MQDIEAHHSDGDVQASLASPSPTIRHRCFLCNRTYERQDHLSRHLKSHENERSYRCPDCGKGFNRADLLNRHRTAHQKTEGETFRKRTGRACESCIKAKTKCEEERPCKRCKSRDQPCQESDARRSSMSRTAGSNASRQSPEVFSTAVEPQTNTDRDRMIPAFLGHETFPFPGDVQAVGLQPTPASASRQMEDASLLLGLNSGHAVSSNLTQNGGEGHKYDTDNLIMDNSNFPDFFEQIMMSNTDLGRQQPANMPFDVSNFTQDLTFDSCDFDFSFLSSGLTRPPTAQAHRLELSDNPGQTPQSDAQLRSEAFEKSPWSWNHWIPERNSHAFSGQEEINIQEDRLQSADQLTSPGSIRLVHVDIDQAARDRMIRVVTKVAHQQLSMPSFPSLELLVDLVDVFLLQDSNSVDSYVHAATFNCKTTRTELLLAMVAAGARYIALPPVWKMGLVIQEVVRLAMGDVFEGDNSTTRELQSLQTVLLWLGIGAFSGFRRKTEIALSFLQSPITMLVWSNAFGRSRYKDIVPDVNDSDEALDSKWRAWAAQESLKRLIIYTFIHDSQVAMINMRNTLISPAQLQIPLPASRQMWLAPNAQAWRNTYYGLGLPGIQTNTLTMLEFFGNNKLLQNLGDTVDHQLCMLAACHGLGHEVWNFRQQGRILIHWRNQGRRDRWLAHQTHQRDLSDDLVAMHAHCELRGDSSLESLLTLELLLMTLHVDFEDVQTFSGKSGEEEARKVFPRVREWSESAEARTALKHAGKVFQVAKAFEKTKLRDFYSVAVYHAALTLWVYGMVLSNTASRSGAPTPMNGSAPPRSSIGGLLSPPEQRVCLDNGDDRAVRAFTLLGQGTPGIQDVDSAFVPLTNCKGLMLTAAAVLKKNFPQSSNGLPALVENLANLMNDLAKLSRKE